MKEDTTPHRFVPDLNYFSGVCVACGKRMATLAHAVAILLAACSFAHAVDFDKTVTQIDGTPFTDAPENATLRRIATNALLAQYPDEQNLDGKVKMDRFFLAKKIQESKGDLQLTADEASSLVKLIGKSYPTLIAAQAMMMIDPALGKR